MNAILTLIVWTATGACVWAGLRAHLSTRRLRTLTTQMANRLEQAAQDRAFAHWSTRTMLTIVRADGTIDSTTLRDLFLHRTELGDGHVWSDPISVSVWHADPDVINRFRQELITEDQDQDRGHDG